VLSRSLIEEMGYTVENMK